MPLLLQNLKIQNQSLAASHFTLTENKPVARTSVNAVSGATSLTVQSNYGLAINKLLLLGTFGEPTAEIVKTSASVAPTSTVIALATAARFDHGVDTPVTLIDWDTVEFYWRASATTGDYTSLGLVGVFANAKFTSLVDLAHTSGYGFFRFYSSITSAYSPSFSDAVPYSGNPQNSVEGIFDAALGIANAKLNEQFTYEGDMVKDVNEAQRVISTLRDWNYEIHNDFSSVVTAIGETTYDLSGLSAELKYPNTKQSFLSVRLGNKPLNYRSLQEIELAQQYTSSSTLTAQADPAETSVFLADSSSFQDQGTVYLRENGYVAYTANNKATGELSGIASSAIATAVPAGATVWQNAVLAVPSYYTVFDEQLILDALPDSTNTGIAFKFRYVKKLDELTSFASVTPIPFWQALQHYVAHRIFLRKRMPEEAQRELDLFSAFVERNVRLYQLQNAVGQQYYTLINTQKSRSSGGVAATV